MVARVTRSVTRQNEQNAFWGNKIQRNSLTQSRRKIISVNPPNRDTKVVTAILQDVAEKNNKKIEMNLSDDKDSDNGAEKDSEVDDYETFTNNYMLPSLSFFEHGKSLKELYDILINPCIYYRLSEDIRTNCSSVYSILDDDVNEALREAVYHAWRIRDEKIKWYDDDFKNNDDDSDSSSNSDSSEETHIGNYSRRKGPTYPEYVTEIGNSYQELPKFLIFTLSFPPLDMCLRTKRNFGEDVGGCFCPFSKAAGRLITLFPRDNKPTYRYLMEKECNKAVFKSDKDLLSHCEDKGDWYHSVYATFLRKLHNIPKKSEKKGNNKGSNRNYGR